MVLEFCVVYRTIDGLMDGCMDVYRNAQAARHTESYKLIRCPYVPRVPPLIARSPIACRKKTHRYYTTLTPNKTSFASSLYLCLYDFTVFSSSRCSRFFRSASRCCAAILRTTIGYELMCVCVCVCYRGTMVMVCV